MELSRRRPLRCCLLLLCALSGGRASLSAGQTGQTAPPSEAASSAMPVGNPPTAALRRVPFSLRTAASAPTGSSVPDSAFAGASVLSVEALVQQVLARNPSLP